MRPGIAPARRIGAVLAPAVVLLPLLGPAAPEALAANAPLYRSPDVEACMARAREALAAGRFVEAHAEAARAESLAPQDASVQSLLGDVARATLRKEAEERYYRRATELDPSYAAARANLALVLIDLGQAREALEQARRALESADPHDPRYPALIGYCLLSQGKPQEAVAPLQVGVDNGLYYAEKSLGRALDLSGRSEEALAVFDRALRRDPSDPQVHFWRAESLRKLGRHAEARKARAEQMRQLALENRMLRLRDELLVHEPDNVGLLVELTRVFLERGMTGDAAATLEKAARLSPGNPAVRGLRGRMGRRPGALR